MAEQHNMVVPLKFYLPICNCQTLIRCLVIPE